LFRQFSDLVSDYSKTFSCFSRPCRFDCRIERKQIGLGCDIFNIFDNIADLIGITQQAYSIIENSDKPPKMETCIKLSKIFEKPIDYIFPDIILSLNTSKTC